jgi:hypothetical protein
MSDYKFEIRKRYPLDSVGTRLEHYYELRDLFADGAQIIEGINPAHRTKLDLEKLGKLKIAVELINLRIDLLAGFDLATKSGSDWDAGLLRIEWDRKAGKIEGLKAIPLLTEGTKNEPQPKDSSVTSPTKDSQVPPDEPAGVS